MKIKKSVPIGTDLNYLEKIITGSGFFAEILHLVAGFFTELSNDILGVVDYIFIDAEYTNELSARED